MQGALARIALAAYEAKKNLKPFTAADVDDSILTNDIVIVAIPDAPKLRSSGWEYTPSATNVVLRPKSQNKNEAVGIQPKATELKPTEWSNAMGGRFTGQGVTAMFSNADLPPAFDIVVVTEGNHRERSCSMKPSDVAKVRGNPTK
jgi:hypothetical protein